MIGKPAGIWLRRRGRPAQVPIPGLGRVPRSIGMQNNPCPVQPAANWSSSGQLNSKAPGGRGQRDRLPKLRKAGTEEDTPLAGRGRAPPHSSPAAPTRRGKQQQQGGGPPTHPTWRRSPPHGTSAAVPARAARLPGRSWANSVFASFWTGSTSSTGSQTRCEIAAMDVTHPLAGGRLARHIHLVAGLTALEAAGEKPRNLRRRRRQDILGPHPVHSDRSCLEGHFALVDLPERTHARHLVFVTCAFNGFSNA